MHWRTGYGVQIDGFQDAGWRRYASFLRKPTATKAISLTARLETSGGDESVDVVDKTHGVYRVAVLTHLEMDMWPC